MERHANYDQQKLPVTDEQAFCLPMCSLSTIETLNLWRYFDLTDPWPLLNVTLDS